jgi:hypothetical protein
MKRKDVNEIAFHIVQQAIGTLPKEKERPKNPEAAELGRKGGFIGGRARAKSLTSKAKRRIASQGATVRWRRGIKPD